MSQPIRADVPKPDEPSTAAEIYGQGIRQTPWLSPEDERLGFHLPDGFEVRLFASEPQIAKPLNMAFDAQGRLWVTQSVEYPYPAADDAPHRDAVMVLSDTDGDGLSDKVTQFADELNIPIGVLPYGEGCICFSIPNLLYLRDTDGDGVCDQRDVILGPFDTTRDTHGMINSLRDGGDGWIYACHGFNNQSAVTGQDGHTATMHSGNTFRFRPDGSRIEVVTHGQVNPFGMTEDHWGFRYSADCHSKPITQLISDACYPSFGRPHDGLGFLPPMVDHLHGSTAICGILAIAPESSIPPLRGQIISGNVMTSRLNRNQIVYQGATATGTELPDFMTSDDPWFRPVDIRLGPDDHIYVADFYNKIIGHYEVPLDHPQRDRSSGRIWQIRWIGEPQSAELPSASDDLASDDLASELASANPVRRRLAASTARQSDAELVSALLFDSTASDYARVAAMQALRTIANLNSSQLVELCRDEQPRVRVEALRQAARFPQAPASDFRQVALEALQDGDPMVVQAASELVSYSGQSVDVAPLLEALSKVDPQDAVQRQSIRIAIRRLYRASPSDSELWQQPIDAELASIMLGLERPEMVELLLSYLSEHPEVQDRNELLTHLVRHSPRERLVRCVDLARELTEDRNDQFQLLQVLADAQNASRKDAPQPIVDWALELVGTELDRFERLSKGKRAIAWSASDGNPWPERERKLQSGESAQMNDSLGRGERYTGKFASDPFVAPQRIRFHLAGHNGPPDQDDQQKNIVRLIDVATGNVVGEVFPPRNDTATEVDWDTGALAGQRVSIEVIDGDAGTAYAWIAIGKFNPPWLLNSARDRSIRRAITWIKRLGLQQPESRLVDYLHQGQLSRQLRVEVAGVVAANDDRPGAAVVLQQLASGPSRGELVDQVVAATIQNDATALSESTQQVMLGLSLSQQREFALAWLQQGAAASELLQMGVDGWVSTSVLADADVRQLLTASLADEQLGQYQTLIANVDDQAGQADLLSALRENVDQRDADLKQGHEVFKKNCANCHQLRGEGVVVGPQLDGAVTRSVERILEDIVTPDQNVDKAFRTTSFLLDDGRILVGLLRSESDTEITLVDAQGKTITIAADTIRQRRDAGRSLMPSNFGEVITADDIADLLGYLRKN